MDCPVYIILHTILFCLISLILCQGGYAGKTQREPYFNCGSYKFEYEQGGADIIVKGWLKASIQFLIDICAYDFVIDTIRDGYKNHFILIHLQFIYLIICLL